MVDWIFISLFSVFTEHLLCANDVGARATVENKTASDSAFLESTDLTETQTFFNLVRDEAAYFLQFHHFISSQSDTYLLSSQTMCFSPFKSVFK